MMAGGLCATGILLGLLARDRSVIFWMLQLILLCGGVLLAYALIVQSIVALAMLSATVVRSGVRAFVGRYEVSDPRNLSFGGRQTSKKRRILENLD
ncbi:hypothetical protein ACYOEI_20635 [Singulisphaera rosea]